MKIAACVSLAAACLAVPSVSAQFQTVTIDFDDQPGGIAPPAISDGMFSPHALFSTSSDSVLLMFAGAGFVGGSAPNTMTAALSQQASVFDSDIYIDFPVAANNVSLNVLADNERGVVANLMVIHAGGTSMVDVIGNANISDAMPIDLSAFTDVTRIELVNITDEFGLSIDDLVFDVPVPAPGPLAVLGLAGLVCGRRRA